MVRVIAAGGSAQYTDAIRRIATQIAKARNVLFITGAGISHDSGIPTYRGLGGLYNNDGIVEEGVPIEEAMSGPMMRSRPHVTWKYLHAIGQHAVKASPNDGHKAIATLRKQLADTTGVWVLTQNVDGLHRRAMEEVGVSGGADARDLMEIHGSAQKFECMNCGKSVNRTEARDDADLDAFLNFKSVEPGLGKEGQVPKCPFCGGVVRPRVVLFGEELHTDTLQSLHDALDARPDVVITVGTTNIFPYVTEGILQANAQGKLTVNINPTNDGMSSETLVANNIGDGKLEPWESDKDGIGHAIDIHLKTGASQGLVDVMEAVELEMKAGAK